MVASPTPRSCATCRVERTSVFMLGIWTMKERGRFAPSPTGELHLGNARTALLSWLWARTGGGGYAIRIEDIDTPRVRPGMAEQQLEELGWLGLDWDGPPVFQSHRTSLYEDALQKLGDHVYECFCSRAE